MPGQVERLEAEREAAAVQPGDPWAPEGGAGEGVGLEADPAPAGVWRRALALLIDAGVVWILLRLGDALALSVRRWDLVAQAFRMTWALVVPAAYVVLCHGTGGRTLGKRLMGARVVEADGRELGYGKAFVRLAATALAAAPAGLGLLVAGLRHDRRGVHDLLAGTRVIRSDP